LNAKRASGIFWLPSRLLSVNDTERDLADCVGAIYQAGTGDGSWFDVGERICRLMNARRALLNLGGPGGPRNLLMPADGSESVYSAYFHASDPYAAKACFDFATARAFHLGNAKLGAELVAENDFLRSEYYFDFARHHERRHVIGGMAGLIEATPYPAEIVDRVRRRWNADGFS
jgi:hypothetical protein